MYWQWFFCWMGWHSWEYLLRTVGMQRRNVTGYRRCCYCGCEHIRKPIYASWWNWGGWRENGWRDVDGNPETP